MPTQEQRRLDEAREKKAGWKRWGPYLSERQWGTVREDYSDDGNAWSYLSHDQARSRAYKWGEDGIAGISDDKQRLCWALALWNGDDPIIKESLFGLTNAEGNHGEDVKEYYFYLDGHAHARIYDVFVEFAKAGPEDILIKISVANRGPAAATLHVLPHIWFRNTWWMNADAPRPALRQASSAAGALVIEAMHPDLGTRFLYAEGADDALFTENETNSERLFGSPNATPFVKDGINDAIVHGRPDAVNPDKTGTKSAVHYTLTVGPGETKEIRLRLSDVPPSGMPPFGDAFEQDFAARKAEADAFYISITPAELKADQASVMRQALAGMMWTKQYYFFDLDRWLAEHGAHPMEGGMRQSRNSEWYHMVNDDIISVPDKWEYL